MDHLDWFTPDSKDVVNEVGQLARVTTPGGFVFWRSAARYPWYNKVFEYSGFRVEPIGIRQGSKIPLDKVNM